jgi:hypothetical protein
VRGVRGAAEGRERGLRHVPHLTRVALQFEVSVAFRATELEHLSHETQQPCVRRWKQSTLFLALTGRSRLHHNPRRSYLRVVTHEHDAMSGVDGGRAKVTLLETLQATTAGRNTRDTPNPPATQQSDISTTALRPGQVAQVWRKGGRRQGRWPECSGTPRPPSAVETYHSKKSDADEATCDQYAGEM